MGFFRNENDNYWNKILFCGCFRELNLICWGKKKVNNYKNLLDLLDRDKIKLSRELVNWKIK